MKNIGHLRVKIIFLLAALAILAISVLSYNKFRHLIAASEWVAHSQKVKSALNKSYEKLLRAESMQRGYIITKDSAFVHEFYEALDELDYELALIHQLTRGNTQQHANVDTLENLMRIRVQSLKNNINNALNNMPLTNLMQGKKRMDNVRSRIDDMVTQQNRLLKKRTEVLQKETLITPVFTMTFMVIALLILVLSYLKIINELNISDALKTKNEEREKQIQNIFTAAPDAVITIDQSGVITNWNAEAEKIFGWAKNEVLGKTLPETIIPERYSSMHQKGMERYLNTGETQVMNKPIEIFARGKNNNEFPVELKISASTINDGSIVFIGFIRDITKRKETEEQLKHQTNQLVEAQQLAHIGSWEWNVPDNKIVWSDELYRIYGLKPQEFEASYENFLKYIHPDDRDHVHEIVQRAFTDQQPFHFIHRLVRPDGSVRTLNATGKVFTDAQGNTIRMAGAAQDITVQKIYEDALVKSEERFFRIFESNPIAMTLSEIKTNKIRYANNMFCETFGYSREEVIGSTSEELNLISPEENMRIIGVLLQYLEEDRSIEELRELSVEETELLLKKLKQVEAMKDFEIEYTRKNGEVFPAVVSFEVLVIKDERFTITSYQDITERKKTETLLRKQNQELESFAYISSHDLQEPLRQIQVFSSRITDEDEQLSEMARNYFNKIQQAANRMQTLIGDLLSYSRTTIEERKFARTNLRAIVEQEMAHFKETIKEKDAQIEIGEMCEADVIPFQFGQMIHNLLGNALKFTRPGVTPHIKISCRRYKAGKQEEAALVAGKDYAHIRISDNGIGFEPQYKDRIFEVFQRLHDKKKIPGTGIGLAIVKKIVENHNGAIVATGHLNEGATFDIYIPENKFAT